MADIAALQKINLIANRAFEDASEIETSDPEAERMAAELCDAVDEICREAHEAIDGDTGWDPRSAAAGSVRNLDVKSTAEIGLKLWAQVGEDSSADNFWNVIEPLALALGAISPAEAGYGEGFSIVTALEQLAEEMRILQKRGELPT
jgi:hypothetical protein